MLPIEIRSGSGSSSSLIAMVSKINDVTAQKIINFAKPLSYEGSIRIHDCPKILNVLLGPPCLSISDSFEIANPRKNAVLVFRLLTNCPGVFRFEPENGFIEPKQSMMITITLIGTGSGEEASASGSWFPSSAPKSQYHLQAVFVSRGHKIPVSTTIAIQCLTNFFRSGAKFLLC